MAYDGSEYIAPDANLVSANKPLDAHALAIARNNALWLLKNGQWAYHGLWREQAAYNAATGDRAYASINKTCIHTQPYYVTPTLESLDVVICGRVQTQASSPTSGTNRVIIWAELAGVGEARLEVAATSTYSDFRLTIPVTNKPARNFATQLRLWVQSFATEDIDTGFRGLIFVAQDLVATNATSTSLENFWPGETYPAPSSSSYNEQAMILNDLQMDHIYRRTESQMVVYPPNPATGDMTRVYLSYLQMRGFALRETHAPAEQPAEQIRAVIPLLGQAAGWSPLALLAALTRPQLLCSGYPGYLDYSRCSGADLPEGYTTPFQWRAVTGNGDTQTIHRLPIWLDEPTATVEVRILYVPVYTVSGYRAGDFDQLNRDAVEAVWEVTASLSEFVDASGDGVLLEYATNDLTLQHLPTDQTGVWPFLMQRRWAGGLTSAQYAPGDERPTYKEGQLFGPDMALLREMVVRVDIEGAPTDKATCLEIDAAMTSSPVFDVPTSVANPDDTDRLQIVVVGLSVWAHYPGATATATPTPYTGKSIASEAAIPSVARVAVGQKVRAADWLELAAQANRLWARRGARGLGRWFDEASDLGEPWITQSSSYTASSGYTGVNERLSNISGPVWMLHEVTSDASKVRMTLEAHGRALDLKAELYALDTGALIDTLNVTASDWELVTDSVELTVANSHEGGSTANPKRLFLVKLQAAISGIGTTARLTYWQLREEPITTTADLPA